MIKIRNHIAISAWFKTGSRYHGKHPSELNDGNIKLIRICCKYCNEIGIVEEGEEKYYVCNKCDLSFNDNFIKK